MLCVRACAPDLPQKSLRGAKAVFAGSFSAFAVFGKAPQHRVDGVLRFDESLVPADDAQVGGGRAPLGLGGSQTIPPSQGVNAAELARAVETAFASPATINGSFLAPVRCFSTNSEDNPGIEFGRAVAAMKRLQSVGGKPVMEALAAAWSRVIRNMLDSCSSKSPGEWARGPDDEGVTRCCCQNAFAFGCWPLATPT